MEIPAFESVRILDDRGYVVKQGQPDEFQTLTFRPRADFHYLAPGTAGEDYQGTRYFLEIPLGLSGPQPLNLRIETNLGVK